MLTWHISLSTLKNTTCVVLSPVKTTWIENDSRMRKREGESESESKERYIYKVANSATCAHKKRNARAERSYSSDRS